jgi:hypothetical protein
MLELSLKPLCPCDLREQLQVIIAIATSPRRRQQFAKPLLGLRRLAVIPQRIEIRQPGSIHELQAL